MWVEVGYKRSPRWVSVDVTLANELRVLHTYWGFDYPTSAKAFSDMGSKTVLGIQCSGG